MAEPVRNNSPLSAVAPSVDSPAPQSAPSTFAPAITAPADTVDTSNQTTATDSISGGQSPQNSGIVPPRPTQTAPRTEPTNPPTVRLEGVSTADAQTALERSRIALQRHTGLAGVGNPNAFRPSVVFRDQQGEVHVRSQRLYRGIPVYGEQAITHFDRNNNVRDVTNGDTPAGLSPDTRAVVSADAARTAALLAFGNPAPQSITQPELVIIRGDNAQYKLAHHIVLTNLAGQEPRRIHYFIDAANPQGGIVTEWNEIHGIVPEFRRQAAGAPQSQTSDDRFNIGGIRRAGNGWPRIPRWPWPAPRLPRGGQNRPGPAAGTGNSIYLGNVPLSTTRGANNQYTLRDSTHRNTETRDQHNADAGEVGADGFPVGSTAITDNNNRWGETSDDPRARAAVDAQYAAARYDDYIRDIFGRNGIDNAGVPGRAVVHTNNEMVNAFYYRNVMWYGDGDGVTAGPLVDKDVASHEPSHGLTEHTSGLIYRGESGALNEAFSDIIGSAGFSWYLRGRRDQGIASDYLVGEDCWTPGQEGDALRYMANPTQDRQGSSPFYSRDHYSDRYTGWQDNGGVHLNSGIANNFFYLIANGGANPTSGMQVQGLGMEKALRIFYRASTVYFTPTTDFAQARAASIRAAEDLYGAGSTEAQTVARGWDAVGVAAPEAAS